MVIKNYFYYLCKLLEHLPLFGNIKINIRRLKSMNQLALSSDLSTCLKLVY